MTFGDGNGAVEMDTLSWILVNFLAWSLVTFVAWRAIKWLRNRTTKVEPPRPQPTVLTADWEPITEPSVPETEPLVPQAEQAQQKTP